MDLAVVVAVALGLPLLILLAYAWPSFYCAAVNAAHGKRVPPGSLGFPLLGENLALFASMKSPLGLYDFVATRYKKHGNMFKSNLLGSINVFVEGKEISKFIFSNEDKLVYLSTNKSMMEVIGPHSILEARGELHKKMRKIMGEPLSMDSLKRHLNAMEDVAINILHRWKDCPQVCVLDETIDFAFQIISYILMTLTTGPEQEKMKKHFHNIIGALLALPINIPGFSYHRGKQAKAKMDGMLNHIIAKRREGKEYNNDFLQFMLENSMKSDGLLLEENARNNGMLSDAEVKDNLVALLFAGHETSAAALMWAIKYIEEYPDVRDKLMIEHANIKIKKGPNGYLTWEDVNSMSYTNKFINETLRVANIARLLPRTTLQEFELNGNIIKKGWKVVLDTQGPHFDATNFDDPHQFQPSRFDESPKPYTFMPFGGGPRMCLGMNLAKVEMAIFIHHLMTTYRWTTISKSFQLAPTLIPKMKDGHLIKVDSL